MSNEATLFEIKTKYVHNIKLSEFLIYWSLKLKNLTKQRKSKELHNEKVNSHITKDFRSTGALKSDFIHNKFNYSFFYVAAYTLPNL